MARQIDRLVADGSGTATLSKTPTDPTLVRLWASGLRQAKDVTFTLAPGSRAIAFVLSGFPPAGDSILADYTV